MDEILNTCHKECISLPSQYQRIPDKEYLDPKNTKKYQNFDNNTLEIKNIEKYNPRNTSKILKQWKT